MSKSLDFIQNLLKARRKEILEIYKLEYVDFTPDCSGCNSDIVFPDLLCNIDDDVNLNSNEGENCEPEPVHEYDDESLNGDVSEEETALSNSAADEFSNDASEAIDSYHLEQVLEDIVCELTKNQFVIPIQLLPKIFRPV